VGDTLYLRRSWGGTDGPAPTNVRGVVVVSGSGAARACQVCKADISIDIQSTE